ncbi:MAG: hypothetical protein IID37_06215 [Planctomycetes bacterium]|nr:hypothetical protein [Planctomycetota bacterium]
MTALLSSIVVLGLTSPGDPPNSPPEAPPADPSTAPSVSTPGSAGEFLLSSLVYPDGVQDETAFAVYLDRQAELLASRVDAASGDEQRITAALESANWILARQIEPAASRLFWEHPRPGDPENILHLVGQAKAQLAIAAEWEEQAKADTAGDENPLAESHGIRLTLQAFADAIEALFAGDDKQSENGQPPTDSSPAQRSTALRRAASGLAIATEDAAPEVVAASVFWQALLLEQAGRRDRVMTLLPQPLTAPPGDGRTWGFLARVFRCRLLCRQPDDQANRGFAAASALLLQLEERAHEWFADPMRRRDAIRACALERLDITRRWSRTPGVQSDTVQSDWLDHAERRILDAHFRPDMPPTVLRMELAVPTLMAVQPVAETTADADRDH